MGKTTAVVNECDMCGHKWVPEVDEPERCPNRDCRSRNWNSGIVKVKKDKGRTYMEAAQETPVVKMKDKKALSARDVLELVKRSVPQTLMNKTDWIVEMPEPVVEVNNVIEKCGKRWSPVVSVAPCQLSKGHTGKCGK